VSATSVPASTPAPPFELTSTAFASGGSIPRTYTCDGRDISPDLAWSGAPAGTAALALLVTDPDANGFVHWVAFDIPGAADGSLPAAIPASAASPRQGTNDFGKRGWGGPCPPSGEHRYRFTVYALGAPLGLSGAPTGRQLEAAIAKAHVLGQVTLEGRYRRG
jgi:Raf kinase inhibitor-like YbhB/YbcL family protein